jgi:copper chaperone
MVDPGNADGLDASQQITIRGASQSFKEVSFHHSFLWGNFMEQRFTVTGMTCGHCEKAVDRAIKQLDPQAEVKIDRQANLVQVQSAQSRESLAHAIAEEGYAVAD